MNLLRCCKHMKLIRFGFSLLLLGISDSMNGGDFVGPKITTEAELRALDNYLSNTPGAGKIGLYHGINPDLGREFADTTPSTGRPYSGISLLLACPSGTGEPDGQIVADHSGIPVISARKPSDVPKGGVLYVQFVEKDGKPVGVAVSLKPKIGPGKSYGSPEAEPFLAYRRDKKPIPVSRPEKLLPPEVFILTDEGMTQGTLTPERYQKMQDNRAKYMKNLASRNGVTFEPDGHLKMSIRDFTQHVRSASTTCSCSSNMSQLRARVSQMALRGSETMNRLSTIDARYGGFPSMAAQAIPDIVGAVSSDRGWFAPGAQDTRAPSRGKEDHLFAMLFGEARSPLDVLDYWTELLTGTDGILER